jgi:3-hydroxyisobutyrate dehydrogenase-like beta-hydroxyacid dehydrogenase
MEAGYLGVGAMGQPMSHKLLDAGHSLTIYDINETAMRPLLERQALRGASPRDLADRCEIVFVSLPTLAAFREVAFGADGLIHGAAMKLLVNTCTVGVPFVREIEQAMAARGVTVIDCPISGGPPGARAGTLSVMVSGDPAAIERVRPMISLWGRTLTVAGDQPGAAQVLKLTNNILSAVALVATAEAFVMGSKAARSRSDAGGDQRRQRPQQRHTGQIPGRRADPQLRLWRRDAHPDEGRRLGCRSGRRVGGADVGVPGGTACVQARNT